MVVAGKLSATLVTAEEMAPDEVLGDVVGGVRATIFALFLVSWAARTDMAVLKQFCVFNACLSFSSNPPGR